MAAGKGGKLGQLTSYSKRAHEGNIAPSCLPVGGRRNINLVTSQAIEYGVESISVVSHHLAGDVISGVGHGEIFNHRARIRHIVTPRLLKHAENVAMALQANPFPEPEPFWVLGATTFHPRANLDEMRKAFASAHAKNPNLLGCVGFVLRPLTDVVGRFGTAVINEDNYVKEFVEKPVGETDAKLVYEKTTNPVIRKASEAAGEALLPVNTSYSLLFREIFEQIEGEGSSIGEEIFTNLPPYLLYAHFMPETTDQDGKLLHKEWYHLGTPRDYWLAQWRFLRATPSEVRGEFDQATRSWMGRDVTIRDGALVTRSIIGDRVYIGPGVVLDGAVVGTGSQLHVVDISDSVLLPYTYVNSRPYTRRVEKIRECVVGGRTTGGTFVDGYSLVGLEHLEKVVAVPDKGGIIRSSPLGLKSPDAEEVQQIKTEIF